MAINRDRFEEILKKLPSVTVAVIGDFAVDGYWEIDMVRSELSRETPFYPKPVIGERYSLGAASNVAANLKDIGCGNVLAVTVSGKDWRRVILDRLFEEKGIATEYVSTSNGRFTPAYIKPLMNGYESTVEDARLDFENTADLDKEAETAFIENIKKSVEIADAAVLCDQLPFGVFTDNVIQACSECAQSTGVPFFADSRSRVTDFRNCILKPNEIEACRSVGLEYTDRDSIQKAGKKISEAGFNVFITAGPDGVYFFGEDEFHQEGFPQDPPLDIVGAGDTFVSSLVSVTAAGGTFNEAAFTACLASSITVKKLNTTGTASPAELLARYDEVQ